MVPLLAGVAWLGVIAGHLVSYLMVYPSGGARHVHLAITGHSWLGLARASALALIPVLLLLVVLRSVRHAASPWDGASTAARLAAIQVVAFLAIELIEREWSVGQTLLDPAVFLGLALQPLLAVVAAWLLSLLERVVRVIVSLLARPQAGDPAWASRTGDHGSASRLWSLFPGRRRAPPLLQA